MNAQKEWFSILQVGGLPIDERVIEKQYRKLAPKYHPDLGGNEEDMKQLNLAKKFALNWLADQRKREQQAAAAKIAAEQATVHFQNAYQQQMASYQSYGGLGSMGAGAYANTFNSHNTEPAEKPVEPTPEPPKPKSILRNFLNRLRGR